MGRRLRKHELETRTVRLGLPRRHEPRWALIVPGLHLGYRRMQDRSGTWYARSRQGAAYRKVVLGLADDVEDADGVRVLDFAQAVEAARRWAAEVAAEAQRTRAPMTVKQAAEAYLKYAELEIKSHVDAKSRINRHILPALGDRPIVELTRREIEQWHRGLVKRDPNDPEVERRSKDTANRTLSTLKALLNRAYQDDENEIPSSEAWSKVKPFKGVSRAREVFLSAAQAKRLLNACGSEALRNLVTAALFTGARAPGELARVRVRHFDPRLRSLSLPDGKTGPREIILSEEATEWFTSVATGKHPDDLLFPRPDGGPWKPSDHTRPFAEAVKRAKLPAKTTIYALRHSYASAAILAGMNLVMLARNMGTSVRLLERNYVKFLDQSRRDVVDKMTLKLGIKSRGTIVSIETRRR